MAIMSSKKRHQKDVTKFFHFAPLNQNFWLHHCDTKQILNFYGDHALLGDQAQSYTPNVNNPTTK